MFLINEMIYFTLYSEITIADICNPSFNIHVIQLNSIIFLILIFYVIFDPINIIVDASEDIRLTSCTRCSPGYYSDLYIIGN